MCSSQIRAIPGLLNDTFRSAQNSRRRLNCESPGTAKIDSTVHLGSVAMEANLSVRLCDTAVRRRTLVFILSITAFCLHL